MTPLAQALNTALLHFIWQGIAVGLLLWIALLLLRRRSANVRCLASCGALLLLAAAPTVTAWTAYTPYIDSRASWKTIASGVQMQREDLSAPAPAEGFPGLHSLEAWILPVWGLGVALFALRLMWCWGHTSALRRTGTPADSAFLVMVSRAAERIGVTRGIRVLMSSVADVPSVIGWARPVLLLPFAVAAGLTPEQLEAVIAHELAHIRRHDYLVNLAQTVVETVLFYHPVVWWVSSRIRYERELCCDDLAVAVLGDTASYARALARLEEVRVFQPTLAMGAANGPLFHRIERLLGGDGLQQGPSRLACAIGLLVGVACLALNMGLAEGRQGERSNYGAMVKDFFPPLPPLQPLPPMPPMAPMPSMKQMLPMPPTPPMAPVYGKVSPLLYAAILAQSSDVAWVVFHGDRVVSKGSSADEAEARAARQSSGGGDTLWFRLEGKTYVTQDKSVVDELAFRTLQMEGTYDFFAREQQEAAGRLREFQAQQQRFQVELQNNLAAIQAQMPNANNSLESLSSARHSLENLSSARRELEKLRRGLEELTSKLSQQELAQLESNDAAKIDANLRDKLEQSERARVTSPWIPDRLREVVRSGKARPVQ